MKNKAILVSFMTIFALVFTLSAVSAAIADVSDVTVDGVSIGDAIVGPSETVPVEFTVKALENLTDVKITVYIEEYDISESVKLSTDLDAGKSKEVKFSIKIPSSLDLDDGKSEELGVTVRVSAEDKTSYETDPYTLTVKKDSKSLNLLSISAPEQAIAGEMIAVDVVIKNDGYDRLDDTYVTASIPELGISEKVYFGDIAAVQDSEYDNIRDTLNKKVYLTVPRNAPRGVYDLIVEAKNSKTSSKATGKISVNSALTGVVPSASAKTIGIGEEATFEVVLINPNDRMVVYSITPSESEGLILDIAEPVVAVNAESSKTVKVKVKATESAKEGTQLVSVNVNGENGELIKQVSLTVNVENSKASGSNTVMILTVVLAIIFVVLLVVLIVLLTKKPAETEEFGETSYY
jgi:hypothetical protein